MMCVCVCVYVCVLRLFPGAACCLSHASGTATASPPLTAVPLKRRLRALCVSVFISFVLLPPLCRCHPPPPLTQAAHGIPDNDGDRVLYAADPEFRARTQRQGERLLALAARLMDQVGAGVFAKHVEEIREDPEGACVGG